MRKPYIPQRQHAPFPFKLNPKFMAPDREHDWKDEGPATKRRFPEPPPPLVELGDCTLITVEYAGHYWSRILMDEE